jgi:hypothetical protein
MATAKQKQSSEGLKTGITVNSFMSGKKIKVECPKCYDEEGSWACVHPAHEAYKGKHTEPVTEGMLATAIVEIAEAVKKLERSGLNRKAVVALIQDDTKLGKGLIETVIISLSNLAKTYTK